MSYTAGGYGAGVLDNRFSDLNKQGLMNLARGVRKPPKKRKKAPLIQASIRTEGYCEYCKLDYIGAYCQCWIEFYPPDFIEQIDESLQA